MVSSMVTRTVWYGPMVMVKTPSATGVQTSSEEPTRAQADHAKAVHDNLVARRTWRPTMATWKDVAAGEQLG